MLVIPQREATTESQNQVQSNPHLSKAGERHETPLLRERRDMIESTRRRAIISRGSIWEQYMFLEWGRIFRYASTIATARDMAQANGLQKYTEITRTIQSLPTSTGWTTQNETFSLWGVSCYFQPLLVGWDTHNQYAIDNDINNSYWIVDVKTSWLVSKT